MDVVHNTELSLADFTDREIQQHFRPCAVDPVISQVFTALYGEGNNSHEICLCSTAEYYVYAGSSRRQRKMEATKAADDIKEIKTNLPTAKTQLEEQYNNHVTYVHRHRSVLFNFYGPATVESRFYHYQSRQQAIEKMVNILVDGGKKIQSAKMKTDQRKSQETKVETQKEKEDLWFWNNQVG
ncbi:hypothetical protein DFQ28_010216 [Apophysomyces sp. BC1034]|nr:hypothetical protein DFQ28_010216 [Apophysomyces sp. BC1034]